MDVVCGLDVGTSGAKALAVNQNGTVIAAAEHKFTSPPYQPAPELAEQDAAAWWGAGRQCLRELSAHLKGITVKAIAVDSTSGTVVPVDAAGAPLMPALMYNDGRAAGLEAEVNRAAASLTAQLGYQFSPTFTLVKLLWIKQERPEIFAATHKFLHAADFIVRHLTGNFVTYTSNALKSGVDLLNSTWSPFIEEQLGLPLDKFPAVYVPGEQVGELSASAAAETGLPAGIPIIAGASDGTASFLASGAQRVGDWNLNIGTTIAIRGIADTLIRDPYGRLYCHRHPEGYWLPGGASNVGGDALLKTFGADRLEILDETAEAHLPTPLLVYPLMRRGERLPFASTDAVGFVLGKPRHDAELFAAYLEGIALVTAWSVAEAAALGAPVSGTYYLGGGGAQGKMLGRVLASLLESSLIVTQEPDAPFGSALLAAGWTWYDKSVRAAQAQMVHVAQRIDPVPELVAPMQRKLEELKAQCQQYR